MYIIAKVEFELAYNDATVLHASHYTTGTTAKYFVEIY